MNSQREGSSAGKPEFEPSELIEYGEAEKLTQGAHNSPNTVDGPSNYTS